MFRERVSFGFGDFVGAAEPGTKKPPALRAEDEGRERAANRRIALLGSVFGYSFPVPLSINGFMPAALHACGSLLGILPQPRNLFSSSSSTC